MCKEVAKRFISEPQLVPEKLLQILAFCVNLSWIDYQCPDSSGSVISLIKEHQQMLYPATAN